MNSCLLSVSEFFTGMSDFVTAHWGEVVAILTSSTLIPILINFVLKLIFLKIQAKSNKNTNGKVLDRLNTMEQKFLDMTNTLKTAFENNVINYTRLVEEKFNDLMNKYQQTKQKIYSNIVNGKEEVTNLLDELEKQTVEVERIITEQSENINVDEEKIEDNQNNIENIDNVVEENNNIPHDNVEVTEQKNKKKVAKRTIVEV